MQYNPHRFPSKMKIYLRDNIVPIYWIVGMVHDELKKKRLHSAKNKVLFYQNHVKLYKCVDAMIKFYDCSTNCSHKPHYSPDLMTSDHFLFPNGNKGMARWKAIWLRWYHDSNKCWFWERKVGRSVSSFKASTLYEKFFLRLKNCFIKKSRT